VAARIAALGVHGRHRRDDQLLALALGRERAILDPLEVAIADSAAVVGVEAGELAPVDVQVALDRGERGGRTLPEREPQAGAHRPTVVNLVRLSRRRDGRHLRGRRRGLERHEPPGEEVRQPEAGDRASWLDFLGELEGDPAWVVADGSKAIRKAVRQRWPKATFYACEFHLGRALAEAATRAGIWPADPAHASLFERAFWSEADWNALATFALDGGRPELISWVADNDALIRRGVKLRTALFGYPRSNAAAERMCDVIDRRFGRRRRYSLRNAKRLALIFALLRAEQAGQADLATYVAIVKRKLLALDDPFHFDWRVLEDPADRLCSIARLLIGARDRARRDTATYMASAKVRSVLRLLDEENRARAASGLAPLVASVKSGRRTLSVEVAGLLLERDFPRLARDS